MSRSVRNRGVPLYYRVLDNVERQGECVVFMGRRNDVGYGRLNVRVAGRRTDVKTHRVAWEHHRGPLPDGWGVLHHCDNPPCCNPDHLFIGTTADNMLDMSEKGRTLLTHCKRGHPFVEGSFYPKKTGGRQCKACYQSRRMERAS